LSELNFFFHPRIYKKRIRKYPNKIFFLILLLLIGFSTLYVWQRVMVIKLLREIEKQKLLLAQEEKNYKYLSLEITELSSFERIEKIAQKEFGLIHPPREQIILVDEGQFNQSSLPGNIWVKLRSLVRKLYPFEEKGVQAKEIKHDL
jgi:cell division protein FtsL